MPFSETFCMFYIPFLVLHYQRAGCRSSKLQTTHETREAPRCGRQRLHRLITTVPGGARPRSSPTRSKRIRCTNPQPSSGSQTRCEGSLEPTESALRCQVWRGECRPWKSARSLRFRVEGTTRLPTSFHSRVRISETTPTGEDIRKNSASTRKTATCKSKGCQSPV